jgi:SAM-dependent methyltransferase
VANEEMKEGWNGESGANWVELQAQFDGTLAPWLEVLGKAADIGEGDRVLDVGCGNGATTLDAARRAAPSGLAVGFDLSEPMLAKARELAVEAHVDNVRFVAGDCQTDDLSVAEGPYDVAISRYGTMFFDDPVAAFANIRQAMRPDGRLAIVVWTDRTEQEWLTVPLGAALEHVGLPEMPGPGEPGMFAFADPDRMREILRSARWHDIEIERQTRRILVGGSGDVQDATNYLLATGQGRALLAKADPETTERVADAIRTALEPHATSAGVELGATAWLVTAHR